MTFTFVEQTGVTVSTSAISLTNGNTSIATTTTKAIVNVWIDPGNMDAGDTYEVRQYEKVVSGGAQKTISLGVFIGEQNGPWVFPSTIVGNGWDFGIIKIGGTDRTFDWSIREVT